MDQYQCIDQQQAIELMEQDAVVADIRDEQSFASGHISGAVHLGNHNLPDFIHNADLDKPVVVCCYHGISSQSAAQYLISQGFDQVYSLNGGFEEWRAQQPERISKD